MLTVYIVNALTFTFPRKSITHRHDVAELEPTMIKGTVLLHNLNPLKQDINKYKFNVNWIMLFFISIIDEYRIK